MKLKLVIVLHIEVSTAFRLFFLAYYFFSIDNLIFQNKYFVVFSDLFPINYEACKYLNVKNPSMQPTEICKLAFVF
tara:strand:+ start:3091 stop:3318 length:228 start_codon:yes stop_codon:yes gene_type:complete